MLKIAPQRIVPEDTNEQAPAARPVESLSQQEREAIRDQNMDLLLRAYRQWKDPQRKLRATESS